MSTQDNKEIIRRVANLINSGDLSALDELYDNDVVYRSVAGEDARGIDEVRDFIIEYQEAFSDFEISLEEIIAEGDKVFILYRQTGTHSKEFMGIPASNNKMNLLIAGVVTFKNGKVVEEFDTFDTLEFLKQLGAVSEEVRPDGKEWPTGGAKLRPQG